MKVETRLPLGDADISRTLNLADVPAGARLLEDLGYDGMVTPELKYDPFLPLAVAATVTTRLELTTSVAIAFPRSPMITALMAWDLQRASRGRFILGLGTQVKGHNERRYSVPWSAPGPRLREYILSLRAIWDSWQYGKPLRFEGEHYRFTLMTPAFNPGPIEHPRIPVHVAGVNPYNCRLAGELGDGIRIHSLHSREYLADVILPAVEAGASRAGRSLKDVEVCVGVLIATAPDEGELSRRVEEVRRRIAFYGSTRTYMPVFARHGWEATVEQLHELSRRGAWDEMPKLISDRMVETFAVVGTYDRIAARLRERYAGLADRIQFSIPVANAADAERLRRLIAELRGDTAVKT